MPPPPGEMPVTAGRGAVYVKRSAAVVFEVPNGVVTVMSTVPAPVLVICLPGSPVMAAVVTIMAAVTVLGGLVTVIRVSESEMIVPRTPPKRTAAARARPVPVMVTVFPPTVVPLTGDTLVTAGETGCEEPDRLKRTPRNVPAIAATTMAAMATLATPERRNRERR